MKANIYTIICLVFLMTGCVDNDSDNDRISSLRLYAVEQISEEELSGAKYKVFNSSNNLIGEYTIADGFADVPFLLYGDYTIEEVHPPEGFYSSQKKQTINISSAYNEDVTFYYKSKDPSTQPTSITLFYYDPNMRGVLGQYDCIRIGEYYWTNSNFTHSVYYEDSFENNYPITPDLISKYMDCAFLDKSQYPIYDIANFEKYYGRYYSRPSVAYIMYTGEMRTETNRKVEGWGLPYIEDYQQLFAMCPFTSNRTSLGEYDVRVALSAREGDNPMALNISPKSGEPYGTYWFDKNHVTNMYGFNMMPGGSRLNGDGPWSNGLGPNDGYWDGQIGDIYHLFYTANFAARIRGAEEGSRAGVVSIYDKLDTRGTNSFHYHNVRFARRLTDQELEYKLYINSAETDIKKLGLEDPVPDGYKELPNGYLRGFYVQYILDNDNPKFTIQDIISFAKQVDDPAVK